MTIFKIGLQELGDPSTLIETDVEAESKEEATAKMLAVFLDLWCENLEKNKCNNIVPPIKSDT